jgi:hypothetical protein
MAPLSWPTPGRRAPRVKDIELAAAFIDVLRFSLAFCDVLNLRGITEWQQLMSMTDGDFVQELRATSGTSIDDIASSIRTLTRPGSAPTYGPAAPEDLRDLKAQVVASAGEFLRSFPLAEACRFARESHQDAIAHRIQTGAEHVRAIYNRLHAPTSPQFSIAAVAYANGSIEMDVAAKLLGLSRSDLAAALEDHGFARPPEVVALDDAHRTAILSRLRAERMKRSGKPHLDSDLVARDVIATQRIEGIDARRWLPR